MATSEVWIGRFSRHLQAGRKSERTVAIYSEAVRDLARFIRGDDVSWATSEDVENFIIDCNERLSSATVNQRFRSLQQLFAWSEAEEEIDRSPMAKMKPPPIDEGSVPALPVGSLSKLLATKKGKTFEHRRDTELIVLIMDTGIRCGGINGITLEGLNLDMRLARVVGKGRRPRAVVDGHAAAKALDKYLRVWEEANFSQLPYLWVSRFGRFTRWGHPSDARGCLQRGGHSARQPASVPPYLRARTARSRRAERRPHISRRLAVSRDAVALWGKHRRRAGPGGVSTPAVAGRSVVTRTGVWLPWMVRGQVVIDVVCARLTEEIRG